MRFKISYVIRMSFAFHLYVACMYSYVILMSLVCTQMSFVCHLYVLVCHPYVTHMYSRVIRMSLVCTRISSVCHSYVLVYHLYVTRMYPMSCVCLSNATVECHLEKASSLKRLQWSSFLEGSGCVAILPPRNNNCKKYTPLQPSNFEILLGFGKQKY